MTRIARNRSSKSCVFSSRFRIVGRVVGDSPRSVENTAHMRDKDRQEGCHGSQQECRCRGLRNDERKLICGNYILQHYDPPWSMASPARIAGSLLPQRVYFVSIQRQSLALGPISSW